MAKEYSNGFTWNEDESAAVVAARDRYTAARTRVLHLQAAIEETADTDKAKQRRLAQELAKAQDVFKMCKREVLQLRLPLLRHKTSFYRDVLEMTETDLNDTTRELQQLQAAF